jgi:hypothetical protein
MSAVERVERLKRPSVPAFPLTQNDHRFYFSTIPVGDLYPYCFVSRRESDPEAGFQRSLNTKRAEDIARYLISPRECQDHIQLSIQNFVIGSSGEGLPGS